MEAGTSRERVSSLHLKRQQIFPLCMEQRNCRSKGPWYILEAVSALELEGFQIMTSGILDAFLDGFTGAGLYERARLPGPPYDLPPGHDCTNLRLCGIAGSDMRLRIP